MLNFNWEPTSYIVSAQTKSTIALEWTKFTMNSLHRIFLPTVIVPVNFEPVLFKVGLEAVVLVSSALSALLLFSSSLSFCMMELINGGNLLHSI